MGDEFYLEHPLWEMWILRASCSESCVHSFPFHGLPSTNAPVHTSLPRHYLHPDGLIAPIRYTIRSYVLRCVSHSALLSSHIILPLVCSTYLGSPCVGFYDVMTQDSSTFDLDFHTSICAPSPVLLSGLSQKLESHGIPLKIPCYSCHICVLSVRMSAQNRLPELGGTNKRPISTAFSTQPLPYDCQSRTRCILDGRLSDSLRCRRVRLSIAHTLYRSFPNFSNIPPPWQAPTRTRNQDLYFHGLPQCPLFSLPNPWGLEPSAPMHEHTLVLVFRILPYPWVVFLRTRALRLHEE